MLNVHFWGDNAYFGEITFTLGEITFILGRYRLLWGKIYFQGNKVYYRGFSKILGFLDFLFFAREVLGLCGSGGGGSCRGFRTEVTLNA